MKRNKNKIELTAVIFIVLILIGSLVYQNRGFLRSDIEAAKPVFSYETAARYTFETVDGNILALDSEALTCMSKNGHKQWDVIKKTSNPRMHTSDKHILVFDRGGKQLDAYIQESKLWEFTTEHPIVTAKINSNGCAAVVSYEIGYKGKVEIIDNTGELLYKWLLSEDYIIDVDVSPDSKYFAAVVLRPGSAKTTSSIIVVDIDGERKKGEVSFDGNLIFSMKYQKNGSIVAVGSDLLAGISPKGEKLWTVDFEGKELESFKLGYNTSSVLSFAGSRNNSVVQIYGKKGQKIGEYISDEEVGDVDIFETTIAAAEKNNVVLLNQNGQVSTKTPFNKNINKLLLLSRHRIAIIGSNGVEILKP
ncbi:MAG: hypothetical protein GX800_07365 [Clostridiaceae bacterium]|nr:hypothetical protein [Clostridiaceae bacterium]